MNTDGLSLSQLRHARSMVPMRSSLNRKIFSTSSINIGRPVLPSILPTTAALTPSPSPLTRLNSLTDEEKETIKRLSAEIHEKSVVIRELKHKHEVEHARQFVGRCFKYMNSHGNGRPKWPLYRKYIRLVEEEACLETVQFETDEMGNQEIKIDTCPGPLPDSDWEEITEDQLSLALAQFLVQVKQKIAIAEGTA